MTSNIATVCWPCNKLNNLWQAFHLSYNTAYDREINSHFLEEIPLYQQTK